MLHSITHLHLKPVISNKHSINEVNNTKGSFSKKFVGFIIS